MKRILFLVCTLMFFQAGAINRDRPDSGGDGMDSATIGNPENAAKKSGPDQVMTYKRVGDIHLHLHVFNPPGHQTKDKTPAIVFFHGGGWINGEPSQFYKQSAYLASKGMVAISVEYRIGSVHQTTPRDCVMDAKSAIRYVRTHSGELGIDPDRIAAGGGSAGGQMAAACALSGGFDEAGEDLSVSAKPAALVLFNPVIDNGPDGFAYSRVKDYWEAFSPIHNIGAQAPPTLIMLGTNDKLIPVTTVERYKVLMEQAGVRCDLRLYEGEAHGFYNRTKYTETLMDTEQFLKSIGYLSGNGLCREFLVK